MNSLDIYREDKCVGCGTCLQKCPALKLSEPEAKAEIKRLRLGEPGKHILGKCLSCFLCDELCPNGANPHSLILRNWHKRIEKKGVPFILSLSAPCEPEPNIWSLIPKKYSEYEKQSVEEWKKNFADLLDTKKSRAQKGDKRDFMLMGCNQWLNPMVTDTEILGDLRLAGSRDFCCGEPYYRAGILDRAEKIFRKTLSQFSTCRADRIIMFCPAGHNMLENVYPKLLGERIKPKLISFPEWLLERIKKGKIKIKKELNLELFVQRNCHSPTLGEEFHTTVLKLLSAIGVKAVEADDSRHFCCGLGASASRQRMLDAALNIARHLRHLPNKKVVCYCNGCLITMAGAENIKPLGFQFYHILDLVRMATGEQYERRHSKRALQLLSTSVRYIPKALMKYGLRYFP